MTDLGVRHLSGLSRLRHLDLSGTGITDQGLEVLQRLPELETVSLAWTRVTDAGIAHLSGCERLGTVNLQGTLSGDGALRALAGKARLGQLRTGNAVTDAGLALLHEFPIFKRWHGGEPEMSLLSYNAGPNYLLLRGPFTDRGMRQLEGLDGLFALNLAASELDITAAGLAPLVGLANLSWLACDAADDAMPYIARMPRLRFLGCQDTNAGDDGFVVAGSVGVHRVHLGTAVLQSANAWICASRRCRRSALSVSCKNVDDAGVAELPGFPGASRAHADGHTRSRLSPH